MRFLSEGNFPVIIREAKLGEPKFAKPPAFDICLRVEDADGHTDWWRGEVSQTYGKGNKSHLTQAQITMETLARIGFVGNDLSTIGKLVDVQTEAWVTESKPNDKGKTYFNVQGLGGGGAAQVEEINPADLAGRIAALFGTPAPTPATPPPAAAPKGNPFGLTPAGAGHPNPFARK